MYKVQGPWCLWTFILYHILINSVIISGNAFCVFRDGLTHYNSQIFFVLVCFITKISTKDYNSQIFFFLVCFITKISTRDLKSSFFFTKICNYRHGLSEWSRKTPVRQDLSIKSFIEVLHILPGKGGHRRISYT